MIGRNIEGGTGVVASMPIPQRRQMSISAVAIAALLLGGCAPATHATALPRGPSPSATLSPVASGPLVTVETRGGECPQAACGSTIVIDAEGRIHATAPAPVELGTVPVEILDGLTTEIVQTDFASLMSNPFTGTCPIAFDGQETIYTFQTSSGVQRIASCEFVVDPEAPLFRAVTAALAGSAAP